MKTYIGKRYGDSTVDPTRVMVRDVDESGVAHYSQLRHYVRHSPEGFNWGYAGSGPADLARCILADYLDNPRVTAALYQVFKAHVIARLPQDRGWVITSDEIARFLASDDAQELVWWLDIDDLPTTDDAATLDAWIDKQEHDDDELKRRYRKRP